MDKLCTDSKVFLMFVLKIKKNDCTGKMQSKFLDIERTFNLLVEEVVYLALLRLYVKLDVNKI